VIRAFVAILLGDAVREAVAAMVDRLRPLGPPVAWVPAANLHLTLQFLGDQPEERLAAAEAALHDAAATSAPIEVALHGIGAFPGLERPRILWVGLAQGALEVRALQARVAEALSRGFPRRTARGIPTHDRTGVRRAPLAPGPAATPALAGGDHPLRHAANRRAG
jgi:2'-5' RNA ligase